MRYAIRAEWRTGREMGRFQTTAHFFVGPRVGAHFVEQRDANDPDVASVVILYRKDLSMTISFPFLPRFRFNYLRA
jgi:hypothetical protein